jgi:predicted LPLAT superfamily acyltransferase
MSSPTPKAAGYLERDKADWAAHRERGSGTLLRLMAFVSLHLGRTLSRIPLLGIAVYFFLFAPSARRASLRYLRLALGRPPRARDRFRQILSFATTIHDRVYLMNGQFDSFDITFDESELMRSAPPGGRGVLLLGAHLGSFEVMRSLGRHRAGTSVAMAMYEANARKINSTLAALNPNLTSDIVPLGKIDAMLNIAERLDRGVHVGVLGDRTLGQEPVQAVTLLPTGPLRAAAILRCRVYFMAGLYLGKKRYHVVFEPLADFTATPAGARQKEVHAAIGRYAGLLDRYCRQNPYNWFNFHDLWTQSGKEPVP